MAGNNIKGITIEINGNTTGLEQSLKGVNKRSKDLQKELKEVEKALKLDPSNTELVRQKQELLTRSIAETSEKLGALKQAQAQVEQQFRRGDIGEEQYRAFQRELQSTEAELKRFETQLQSVGTEQDKLGRNQRDLQTYLSATGKTVDDLSNVLGTRLANAIRDGSASADQLEMALNRIGRQAGHSGEDLERFRLALRNADNGSSLDEIRRDLDRVGESADDAEKDISELTDGLKNAANAASVATAALGGAALLSAAQFDNAIGQIQAGLGVTRKEAEALEAKAREVWKAGFGESLEDVSSGLIRVKQNMKEINGNEIESVTKSAFSLAKAFESDVNEVTRAANNLMVNFGITSKEAFDLLSYGAQNGLNFSNELFDNVAEYSGLFKTLGFTAEEYFQTLEKGSQMGVYNLDYLNDVIKEFGIRIKDGSTATSDALSDLFRSDGFDTFMANLVNGGQKTKEFMELSAKVGKESAAIFLENVKKTGPAAEKAYEAIEYHMGNSSDLLEGLSNGSIRGVDAMQTVLQKISEIEDPMMRAQTGVALFGTKWEDLEETAMLSLMGVDGNLQNLEGRMNSLSEVQEQTFGQRWESFTRRTAESLEPLGEILLRLAEEWLPKVISVVESVAVWFDNLSPKAQNVVMVIGAIVAIVGPLITILGIMIPIIGNVIGLFSKASAAAGVFKVALGFLTGPVGIVIGIIAALVTAGVLLYKNWDTVKEKASQFGQAFVNIFKNVKDKISGIIDAIKGYFSGLKLKMPKIVLPKMPSFGLKTSSKTIFGKEITYPSGLDIKWNALGGIFTKPTIFNTANAGLQGVGEAGPEAILPLNAKTLAGIGKGIAEQMNGSAQALISGNNFFIREEADVTKIAQELFRMQQQAQRR